MIIALACFPSLGNAQTNSSQGAGTQRAASVYGAPTLGRAEHSAFPDCNGNGIDDAVDISSETSRDYGIDGVPDECVGGAERGVSTYFHSKLIGSQTHFAFYGWSVSVSGDTALVGEYNVGCAAGASCGQVYVYRFNGSTWVEETIITPSDPTADKFFGIAVSLSGDTAVIGAQGDHDGCGGSIWCGAAYIYHYSGSTWVEEAKFTGSLGSTNESVFGHAVSVSGDTVVVGSPSEDCAAGQSFCGAAYVYRFNGSVWAEEARVTASDAVGSERFGMAVSTTGETIIAGAPTPDAAYVFRFNGNAWVEEAKLARPSAPGFGSAVSASGDAVLIGAPGDGCGAGATCGSAFVFRFNGSVWVEEAFLRASDPTMGAIFGDAVSLSGNNAIIGAKRDDCVIGFECGAAYVFNVQNGVWSETVKLYAKSGPTSNDQAEFANFGASVSISGTTAFVGAPNKDVSVGGTQRAGAAYVYSGFLDADCNANGIEDAVDISTGTSEDCNADAIPDECDLPYALDDGSAENGIGWGADPADIIWLNQFTVVPGITTISSVSVFWSQWQTGGESATVIVWDDPNNDGNPSDAVVLSATATTSSSNAWTTVAIPPVDVGLPGDNFFVGVFMSHAPNEWPAGLDTSSNLGRSWWASGQAGTGNIHNLPANLDFGTIGAICCPGNWAVRAYGDVDCAAPGACCHADGSCTNDTPEDCVAASGTFQGEGVPCAGQCPVTTTGACCANGACAVTTETECTVTIGGRYKGDDTDCTDPLECAGACCDGTTCIDDAAQENCPGEYFGDGTTCTQPGPDSPDCATATIPTLSEWGLITMLLLILVAGTLVLSQQRSAGALQ